MRIFFCVNTFYLCCVSLWLDARIIHRRKPERNSNAFLLLNLLRKTHQILQRHGWFYFFTFLFSSIFCFVNKMKLWLLTVPSTSILCTPNVKCQAD